MNNFQKNVKKTISLYNKDGFTKIFTKIRFWDAPFQEISQNISKKADILDLGCGEGTLANFLAVESESRKIIGIDLDKYRIAKAYRGLENTRFTYGNALEIKISQKFDVILMTHLLHHLPSYSSQETLVKNIKILLKKKGKIIITEADNKPLLKYFLSWFADHFVVPILFEKNFFTNKIYFRSENEWKKLLTESGFKINIIYAHKHKPFSHIIFICTK